MTLSDYFSREHGAQARIAKMLDISPPLLSQWKTGERQVPAERCPDLERATGGGVCCEVLLPGRRWVRVPDADWPHPDGRPLLDVATPDAPQVPAPTEAE